MRYKLLSRLRYLLSATMYYRPLNLLDRRTNQLRLARMCITGNTKTDYSKTRRIRFFLPWREGLNAHFENMHYRPKISINGHGLLLRLQETKMAMTAVFKRGIIPYHSHQKSRPGVEQLRYKTSFNSTISSDQLSATVLDISTRV